MVYSWGGLPDDQKIAEALIKAGWNDSERRCLSKRVEEDRGAACYETWEENGAFCLQAYLSHRCYIGKILENILVSRLNKKIEKKNPLLDNQYGSGRANQ